LGFGFELEACPVLHTLLDFFVAITEGVGMVLENDATAQVELTASLFYLLKVGDDGACPFEGSPPTPIWLENSATGWGPIGCANI
jgi:hypothetical protein